MLHIREVHEHSGHAMATQLRIQFIVEVVKVCVVLLTVVVAQDLDGLSVFCGLGFRVGVKDGKGDHTIPYH